MPSLYPLSGEPYLVANRSVAVGYPECTRADRSALGLIPGGGPLPPWKYMRSAKLYAGCALDLCTT